MRLRQLVVKALGFFLPPLVAVELTIRLLTPNGPFAGVQRLVDFYHPLRTGQTPVHYLFIGSSRVAAAVDVPTFREVLRPHAAAANLPPPLYIYNLGQGYSTLAEHYLALRCLPDSLLTGTVLLVGLKHGVPPGDLFTDTWDGLWADPRWPLLLSPILRLEDLPTFWWQAGDAVRDKLVVTAGLFLHSVRYGRFIRGKVRALIEDLPRRLGLRPPVSSAPPSLAPRGGIRTDSAGIAAIRRLMLEQMQHLNALRPDSVIPDWDQTVFADLVRLLQRRGGRVAVFNVPLTSWHRLTDRPTPEKIHSFRQWAYAHDMLVLEVPATYPDEAFPDLVHLADAYAPDFTRKLAEVFLQAITQEIEAGSAY
ncbi:hypothetical protein [Rhodothermus profundi]|uniref:Uncharacterized protein n=1 Tax=Rhodothermus profundi TaxID=633813 RepID=A0A1M6XIQ0_9BACT|nr:hypothetical protein [Rhodothermus profundi]SHL05900.1 hypothetical protein SAMN04488087_2618 [Rhodothermus profundi]